jgi:Fic-DOC domain mobile mystery protein B
MLTRRFMAELHGRMFDETWTWAGEFRRSDKNIGVHWPTIEPALQDLIDDTAYQLDASTYPPDEILARFHHRLVTIHAFPNGNGRHARLMTDLLAAAMGQPALTWGRGDLIEAGDARARYLAALRQADRGRISVLLDFMRS